MNYINTLLVTLPNVVLIPFKKRKKATKDLSDKPTFPFPPSLPSCFGFLIPFPSSSFFILLPPPSLFFPFDLLGLGHQCFVYSMQILHH